MVEQSSSTLFDKLKKIEPTRVIPVTLDEINSVNDDSDYIGLNEYPRSATATMNMHKLTDMQTAAGMIDPDLGEELNHIKRSRVFPDNYVPMQRLLTKDLLMKSIVDETNARRAGKPSKFKSFTSILMKVNTAESIGIDGEGIIDVLSLYGGAAREEAKKGDML